MTMPEAPEIPVTRRPGGRASATRHPDGDTVIVRGSDARKGSRYMVGVKEAALLAPAALRQALREAGIEVRGRVATGETPQGAELVHRHYSIPLGDKLPSRTDQNKVVVIVANDSDQGSGSFVTHQLVPVLDTRQAARS